MQAVQQHWLPNAFGGFYDKFACSKGRVMSQNAQPLKRAAADPADATSPSKRLKLADAGESQSLRSQQPVAPKPSFTAQAPSQQQAPATPSPPKDAPSDSSKPGLQPPQDPDQKSQQPRDTAKFDSSKLDLARQKIEANLNLEILLKHDEMRLIEQELAKAQICLEQIRRCRLIPYPGHSGASSQVDMLSDGVGPALEPAPGMHRPAHAAPWGVTDGPYTQHYAKWLIPDPAFDPAPLARNRNSVTSTSYDGRGLRSVVGDALAGRRRHRQSVDVPSPLSPSTSAPPKIPGGPLLLTRADGVRVKLVCRHCSKEDINSVQGFLNHCRIAHSDSMKTHAEAAAMHGVPLEEGELQQAPTPPVADQSPATPTAVTTPTVHALPRINVHPLNAVGRSMQPPATPTVTTPARPSPLSSSFSASGSYFPQTHYSASPGAGASRPASVSKPTAPKPRARPAKPVVTIPGSNFVPSPQTPSLSNLLEKRGINYDLSKLVTSAKQRVDLDQVESLVADSEVEDPKLSAKSQPKARQVSGVTRAPAPASGPAPLELERTIPDSASSSFAPGAPSSPAPESLSPRSATHTANTSETNPGMITDREDEPDDDLFEIGDSEDDRASLHRRNVRVHGEDFPMTDATDASNKFAPMQASPLTEPPKEKKRGRPRKQK